MRWFLILAAACGRRDAAPVDAAASDGVAAVDAAVDASADALPVCAVFGAPGACMPTATCAALADHTAYAGHCTGPADIQCCIRTPSVADNPPIPTGDKLMAQANVTPDMTTWAVAILNDPVTRL